MIGRDMAKLVLESFHQLSPGSTVYFGVLEKKVTFERRADAVLVDLTSREPRLHVFEAKSSRDNTYKNIGFQIKLYSVKFDYAWAIVDSSLVSKILPHIPREAGIIVCDNGVRVLRPPARLKPMLRYVSLSNADYYVIRLLLKYSGCQAGVVRLDLEDPEIARYAFTISLFRRTLRHYEGGRPDIRLLHRGKIKMLIYKRVDTSVYFGDVVNMLADYTRLLAHKITGVQSLSQFLL